MKNYELFLDLDGVFADFHRGVLKTSGKTIEELGKKRMWQVIGATPTFFLDLEMFEASEELWEVCRQFEKVRFLTGAPSSYAFRQQKKDWVAKTFGTSYHVDVVPRKDKQKFAHQTGILIDDTEANIVEWRSMNGIGIHHTNDYQQTIEELKKFL